MITGVVELVTWGVLQVQVTWGVLLETWGVLLVTWGVLQMTWGVILVQLTWDVL